MKLTVVGATGRTGNHVLAEGERRGHHITAFTRRPERLNNPSKVAGVIHGDGRNPDAAAAAVAGADAVIAVISAGSRKGPHQSAEVAQVLVTAMATAGVRRLVVTSAYPIVADRPRVPIAFLRLILRAAYADLAQMERIVSASDLDWTIARLNRLLDKPARGRARISTTLLDKPAAITRADAAATLLDLAESDRYAKSAVNLSGAEQK
jgi:putative NADH-flavin reductase